MVEDAFRSVPPGRLLALGVLLVGVGLALTGLGFHVEAAGARCDGCAPYHPLFVLAPVASGAALTTVGGWLFGRE
ncbi:hypothetical protein [Halorarius halobius]|uniref:hypothetical protein n=1 Tax=Halorarius halobius TaxID=2962671 RepID=UPI0020CDAB5E|nr:hypothetical protein [Halorarius halobius]